MKILFMGTPDYAATILRALVESGENVSAVITQPDKPKGRGYQLTPPVVKVLAVEKGLPVYQPQTLRDETFMDLLRELDPELIIVAAYGKLLPPAVLEYPKYGCINAHASLLPKYRGAAPIQRAIMDGETETGVTSMYMAEGLDTGDMILKVPVTIEETDDFETVHDKLAEAGARAMLETVAQLKNGTVKAEAQDENAFTYAAKITKEDCVLDFSRPAREVYNRIRALSPFPLSFCRTPDERLLKIVSARLTERSSNAPHGTVVSLDGGVIAVSAGGGILEITGVLPEGKGRMKSSDFINGRRISVGDVLR